MLETRKHILAFIRASRTNTVYVRTNSNIIVAMAVPLIVRQVRAQLHAAKMGERPDLVGANLKIIQVYSRLADIMIGVDQDMDIQFVLQVHSEDSDRGWWLVVPDSSIVLSSFIDLDNDAFAGNTAFSNWIATKTPRKSPVQQRLLQYTIDFYLKAGKQGLEAK